MILILPEIYFLLAVLLLLGFAMVKSEGRLLILFSRILAGIGVGISLWSVNRSGLLFEEMVRIDFFSQVFKVLLAAGLFLVTLLSRELSEVEARQRSVFFLLLFVSTLALMMLVSAGHLLPLYLSLELSSYSLYILAAMRRDASPRPALNYFFTGICASALMLLGMAILYAATQTLALPALSAIMADPMETTAVLLIFSGFFFKLALFPFHFWVPGIYQTSATPLSAYIATVSKAGAVAVLVRVMAARPESLPLETVLLFLAIVSMTLGNLAALAQKDLKRLLGYSTVAHAGYVLIGILTATPAGYAGAVGYAAAVLVMTYTVFFVVGKVEGADGKVELATLAGLHNRAPVLALALMVALFSLAGIPPTIGFAAKFVLFSAAMQEGHFTLVLIAMINVVISLYYYLLILKAAYLAAPEAPLPKLALSRPARGLAAGLILVMILAGFCPGPMVDISRQMIATLTG